MSASGAHEAVLLVAHGTASASGRRTVRELVDVVAARLPGTHVSDAYVDVQTPRVGSAVAQLSGRFERVTVVPLLLCGGYHVRVDVARAVADQPRAVSTGALGPSALIARALVRRLHEAGATPRDRVILAAAGSTRPEAAEDARTQATLLEREWGAPVLVAYGSAGSPSVPEAVAGCRGNTGRVVVAAMLLGHGHFHGVLRAAGADVVTEPLGTAPEVVEQILARVRGSRVRHDLS